MNSDDSTQVTITTPATPEPLKTLYLTIEKEKIGLLKFLLEGYDGLCIVTTLSSAQGRIKLVVPGSRVHELDNVLKNISFVDTDTLNRKVKEKPELLPDPIGSQHTTQ